MNASGVPPRAPGATGHACSGAAEEWLLWREAAREAAGGDVFLDDGALAESLQRASELAADYGTGTAGRRARERGAACCTRRNARFDDALRGTQRGKRQCTRRRASSQRPRAGVCAAAARLRRAAPRACARSPPRAPRAPCRASAAPRCTPRARTHRAGARGTRGHRRVVCERACGAEPDARLLVMLPGPAGARERLAALIRAALDPADSLRVARETPRAWSASKAASPSRELPLPAQALREPRAPRRRGDGS